MGRNTTFYQSVVTVRATALKRSNQSASLTADIFTCHSGRRTGVLNNINDGSVPLKSPSEPAGTAIITVINFTCASPAVTSKDVRYEKAPRVDK